MNVLVPGGAGFIGSNFVSHLIRHTDHRVVTLDALTYAGSRSNLDEVEADPRHDLVVGDIRDRPVVDSLVDDADVVVNFAAESHVDRSIEGATSFVRTNIEGAHVLLEATKEHGVRRFVQISTDEVYGEVSEGTFSEDDCVEPRNPYAASKASADLLARSFFATHDVPVVITRSSNNYGPGQHEEKLIPKAIARAAAGEPIPVYGDGSNVREWTYVADNCRAIATLLSEGEPGGIYNVGSGLERQNIEVVRRIVEEVGASEDQIRFVEDRPGHDERYALDSSRIRSLGWSPEVPFEEGLSRTVDYYL